MIKNFSSYYYKNGEVRYIKNDKLVKPFKAKKGTSITLRYKLQDDNGNWKGIAASTIEALAGQALQLPSDATAIIGTTDYFIDKSGTIYSFASDARGTILTPTIGSNGYLSVSIYYDGVRKTVDIHKLVAETFIMENYVTKGFVCMHKDNDKTNCHIDNLCIGTYSQNNKDAYRDGLNPGNGFKKSTE